MLTRLLTPAILVVLRALLQGCGFRLRGSADVPPEMQFTYIQAAQDNAMARELRQAFAASNVPTVDSPKQAKTVLRLLREDTSRRVRAVDRRGKVIDFELTYEVVFDALDAEQKELLPVQTITLVRTQVNPDVEVLGKQEEQALFFEDMRRDMANRILDRVRRQLR